MLHLSEHIAAPNSKQTRTSAPIGAWKVKPESMTDRPTDQPTKRPTDGHEGP